MLLPSQRTSSENDGTIIVVGGGPVGLYYIAQQAHNARNASPPKVYNIHLYEARIKQGPGGHFIWKEEADNNNSPNNSVYHIHLLALLHYSFNSLYGNFKM